MGSGWEALLRTTRTKRRWTKRKWVMWEVGVAAVVGVGTGIGIGIGIGMWTLGRLSNGWLMRPKMLLLPLLLLMCVV